MLQVRYTCRLVPQIERRRAERKRAAQLNTLAPEQRKAQLATELQSALEQAKSAKASGNKEHKRVAGEVIKQIKLEISSSGYREAELQALIASRSNGGTHAPGGNATAATTPVAVEAPNVHVPARAGVVADARKQADAAADAQMDSVPKQSRSERTGPSSASKPQNAEAAPVQRLWRLNDDSDSSSEEGFALWCAHASASWSVQVLTRCTLRFSV